MEYNLCIRTCTNKMAFFAFIFEDLHFNVFQKFFLYCCNLYFIRVVVNNLAWFITGRNFPLDLTSFFTFLSLLDLV